MTRPDGSPLIGIGELLTTLEITLAELRIFTDELRDEITREEDV